MIEPFQISCMFNSYIIYIKIKMNEQESTADITDIKSADNETDKHDQKLIVATEETTEVIKTDTVDDGLTNDIDEDSSNGIEPGELPSANEG